MKKIKKIISLIMALLIMCLAVAGVSAEDGIINDENVIFEEDYVNDTGESLESGDSASIDEELVPMMAARCGRTFGIGEYTIVEGEVPDPSGHNEHGPCTYIICYYEDGSSYATYTDRRGTQHVKTYSDKTTDSWWT